MYRTAKHRKDWTGGVNQWNFNNLLKEKGYEVGSCRCETNDGLRTLEDSSIPTRMKIRLMNSRYGLDI